MLKARECVKVEEVRTQHSLSAALHLSQELNSAARGVCTTLSLHVRELAPWL